MLSFTRSVAPTRWSLATSILPPPLLFYGDVASEDSFEAAVLRSK